MKKHNDNTDWTSLLEERMKEHRLEGYGDLWPGIEEAMRASAAKPRRPRRAVLWLRAGVATAAGAAAIVAALLWPRATQQQVSLAPAAGIAKQQQSNAVQQGNRVERPPRLLAQANQAIKHIERATNSTQQPSNAGAATKANTQPKEAVQQAQIASTQQQATNQPTEQQPLAANAQSATPHSKRATMRSQQASAMMATAFEPSVARSHSSGSSWDVGLYSYNAPATLSSNGGDMANMDRVLASDPLMGGYGANTEGAIGVANVELRHKQPVSFGATARFGFAPRWSVEAGLAYTYLSADYNDSFMAYDQSLHYMGVPVKLNYTVLQSGRFDVYLTAGAMAEKLVSGKLKTQNLVKQTQSSQSVKEGGLQWSAKGAVGASVRIAPFMAVYVEPGISHYFNNGSEVQNFYKKSPTNFNLLIGVRFNASKP